MVALCHALKELDFASMPQSVLDASTDQPLRRCTDCGQRYPFNYEECPIDGYKLAWSSDPVFSGEQLPEGRLSSRYDVVRFINNGSLTFVYEGKEIASGKTVALKVFRGDLVTDHRILKEFEHEAIMATMLTHKNTIAVLAFGYAKKTFSPRPYLAVEYVHGVSLSDVFSRFGPLAPAEATAVFMQIAEALEFAHGQNILHKELKPSNIFIAAPEGDAMVKVADFGISERLFTASDSDLRRSTRSLGVPGDPLYFAPEIARNAPAAATSDIYSAGCIFYEALAGRPPFKGDTPFDTLYRHAKEAPPPFDEALAIPAQLQSIVFKCLEKEQENRFSSAGELRAQLGAIA
jgi:serine/threonine-protein kinase